jgi:hypothetical protein
MSPVSATPERSSMNGSVEYSSLNVGFVPSNIADRMPAVGRQAADPGISIGICVGLACSTSGGGGIQNVIGSGLTTMAAQTMTVDASSIVVDTTGTTFSLGSSGTVTVEALDANGTMLASEDFTWVASGTQLQLQNPSAVQSFLTNAGASNVSASVQAGPPPASGTSTVSTAVIYQGTQRQVRPRPLETCAPKG